MFDHPLIALLAGGSCPLSALRRWFTVYPPV
jgi:hypothetical protein